MQLHVCNDYFAPGLNSILNGREYQEHWTNHVCGMIIQLPCRWEKDFFLLVCIDLNPSPKKARPFKYYHVSSTTSVEKGPRFACVNPLSMFYISLTIRWHYTTSHWILILVLGYVYARKLYSWYFPKH
jgi:hypothetical protein